MLPLNTNTLRVQPLKPQWCKLEAAADKTLCKAKHCVGRFHTPSQIAMYFRFIDDMQETGKKKKKTTRKMCDGCTRCITASPCQSPTQVFYWSVICSQEHKIKVQNGDKTQQTTQTCCFIEQSTMKQLRQYISLIAKKVLTWDVPFTGQTHRWKPLPWWDEMSSQSSMRA